MRYRAYQGGELPIVIDYYLEISCMIPARFSLNMKLQMVDKIQALPVRYRRTRVVNCLYTTVQCISSLSGDLILFQQSPRSTWNCKWGSVLFDLLIWDSCVSRVSAYQAKYPNHADFDTFGYQMVAKRYLWSLRKRKILQNDCTAVENTMKWLYSCTKNFHVTVHVNSWNSCQTIWHVVDWKQRAVRHQNGLFRISSPPYLDHRLHWSSWLACCTISKNFS